MLPFSQHTALHEQYENFTGGGTSLATLTFTTMVPQTTVPVTHTKIDASFIFAAGKSSDTTAEQFEFRAALIPDAMQCKVEKGLLCSLVIKPGAPPIRLQLWTGGLLPGGEIYRFMLVDQNFHS